MTTTLMLDHVVAYASQVRFCLRDLGPEQVEELTDGLEADLAEAVEDPDGRPITGETPVVSGSTDAGRVTATEGTAVIDLALRFGSPDAYAAELRAAAGLPPAQPVPEALGPLGHAMQWAARRAGAVRGAIDSVTNHPKWPAIRDAVRTVLPLWAALAIWVFLNAALAIFVGIRLLPAILIALGFVALLSILSIRFYRGTWAPKRGVRHMSRMLTTLAIILLVPMLAASPGTPPATEYVYLDASETYLENSDEFGTSAALYVGGQRATNLFVYGPDGEFIDGARILDQDGRPVHLTPDGSLWDPMLDVSMFWEPRTDAKGAEVWNAYPLGFWTSRMANWDEEAAEWVLPEGVNIRPQVPPIASLSALEPAPKEDEAAEDEEASEDSPDPTPSPGN